MHNPDLPTPRQITRRQRTGYERGKWGGRCAHDSIAVGHSDRNLLSSVTHAEVAIAVKPEQHRAMRLLQSCSFNGQKDATSVRLRLIQYAQPVQSHLANRMDQCGGVRKPAAICCVYIDSHGGVSHTGLGTVVKPSGSKAGPHCTACGSASSTKRSASMRVARTDDSTRHPPGIGAPAS